MEQRVPSARSSRSSAGPAILRLNEPCMGGTRAVQARAQSAPRGQSSFASPAVSTLTTQRVYFCPACTTAAREKIDADSIVTGTGSGELLRALGLLYGRDGAEIICAAPTYEELPKYAALRGAALKPVPVDAQLRHDLAAMAGAVTERTRAI